MEEFAGDISLWTVACDKLLRMFSSSDCNSARFSQCTIRAQLRFCLETSIDGEIYREFINHFNNPSKFLSSY